MVPWGTSGWTDTQRVTTEVDGADGGEADVVEYFLKSCSEEVAQAMFKGEFTALNTLHELMPESCPKPFGWGEYVSSPGTFFILMEFLYLIPKEPSASKIAHMIADVHRATAGKSPDKQFGFYVPTCHGKILQPNEWDKDWTRFFTRLMTVFYDAYYAVHGPFPAYDAAFATLKAKVIPRLLNALTADGREIVPCLVHGDLWHQNIGVNEATDELMLYDPAFFYAHNEFEMGMWRTSFVPFDESYRNQYTQFMPASQPTSEWDDRNRLYSLFYHFSHSAHWLVTAEATRLM